MNENDLLELQARASLQLYLLEHLYSRVYRNAPEKFEVFIEDARLRLIGHRRLTDPMPLDRQDELCARIATHLLRFERATLERIASMPDGEV